MAVNHDYYGMPDSWRPWKTSSNLAYFEVKLPTFKTFAGNYVPMQGAIGIKWGQGELTDPSFAYIAMDKDAPYHDVLFASKPQVNNNNDTRTVLTFDVQKNVPVGFTMQQLSPAYGQYGAYDWQTGYYGFPQRSTGDFLPNSAVSMLNYQSTVIDPKMGWYTQPVLSFPFQKIRLVPVLECYRFASGKTADDLDSAATAADYNACITGMTRFDLDTYLHGQIYDSGDTHNVYDLYPVIRKIIIVPVAMDFTGGVFTQSSASYTVPQYYDSMGFFTPAFLYGQQVFSDVYYHSAVGNDYTAVFDITPTLANGTIALASVVSGATVSGTTTHYTYFNCGGFLAQGSYDAAQQAGQNIYIYPLSIISAGSGFVSRFATDANTSKDLTYRITTAANLDALADFTRKCCAYFGMFFTDGYLTPVTDTLDTAGVYLGVVDANGITHGTWTEGADNATQPNYTWTDPQDDTPYNPGGGGGDDTEDPSDPYTPYPQPENGFGVCLKYYALRRGDLQDLIDWIYYYTSYDHALDAATQAGTQADFNAKYPDPAAWVAHVCERAGYNVFPTNDIVGVMAFPFDLSGADAGYMLGHWDTSIYHDYFHELADAPLLTGKLLTNGYKLLNMGSHDIQGRFGDYRDYPPYSRIELQVPYHGTVDLDPADWIGKTVAVSIIVDLLTGSSLAIVSRVSGGVSTPVITMPGQMGISVPITADNAGQTANTFAAMSTAYQTGRVSFAAGIAGDVISAVQGTAGAVLSAATLDAGGVISSAPSVPRALVSGISSALNYGRDAAQQIYEMQHIANGKMIMGAGSPSTSFAYEYRCRIVYHYPTMLTGAGAESFTGILGHACNSSGRIGDFSGFTKFGAADLSGIPCTADEQQIILDLLQNGIFL